MNLNEININLIKLNYNDQKLLDLILKWRNNEDTRFFSNNTNIITPDNFNIIITKYKESKIEPIIIYNNTEPIGIISFIKIKDNIYIGINIDNNYRNKHVGSISLQKLIDNSSIFFNKNIKIYAQIKKNNIASLKLFEKFFILLNETENYKEFYRIL